MCALSHAGLPIVVRHFACRRVMAPANNQAPGSLAGTDQQPLPSITGRGCSGFWTMTKPPEQLTAETIAPLIAAGTVCEGKGHPTLYAIEQAFARLSADDQAHLLRKWGKSASVTSGPLESVTITQRAGTTDVSGYRHPAAGLLGDNFRPARETGKASPKASWAKKGAAQ